MTHSSDEKSSLSGNHHHYHQIEFSKHAHVQNMFVYSDPREAHEAQEKGLKKTAKVHHLR